MEIFSLYNNFKSDTYKMTVAVNSFKRHNSNQLESHMWVYEGAPSSTHHGKSQRGHLEIPGPCNPLLVLLKNFQILEGSTFICSDADMQI